MYNKTYNITIDKEGICAKYFYLLEKANKLVKGATSFVVHSLLSKDELLHLDSNGPVEQTPSWLVFNKCSSLLLKRITYLQKNQLINVFQLRIKIVKAVWKLITIVLTTKYTYYTIIKCLNKMCKSLITLISTFILKMTSLDKPLCLQTLLPVHNAT